MRNLVAIAFISYTDVGLIHQFTTFLAVTLTNLKVIQHVYHMCEPL